VISAYRVALVGGICAVVAWATKAVAIGLAGGLDRSAAEGPLFLIGLVSALVGAGALGAAVTADRSAAVRVVAGAAAIVAVLLVAGVVTLLVTLVQPRDPSWVWGELNLWISALALLAAVLVWRVCGQPLNGRPHDR
jgi:hypothetical protein